MTRNSFLLAQCVLVLLLIVGGGCTNSETKLPAPSLAESAQPLFVNGGFESGDLSGWTVTTYTNPVAGVTYPPASVSDLNLQGGGTNLTSAVGGATMTQVPNGLTSASSLRYPGFGNWSAVVNERGNNRNVNLLSQTSQTTAADVDPVDGKIHVRFTIAPVLENPGHPVNQQPYFYIVLTNVTQNKVLFSTFNFSNQTGVPWKTDTGAPGVLYTDWQIVDVAPGSTGLAIGDTVKLDVYSAGCALGAHYGEVYVDAAGAFLPGLSVAGHGPQSANAGSNITYSYLIKNSGGTTANNVTLSAVLPDNTTFVSVTPPAGITCTTPSVGGTGTVTCNVGSLNPSAGTTVLITVNINSGATGTINNGNYTIHGDGTASLIGPLIQTNITTGVTYADLSVSMSDGAAAVGWGQPVHYVLQVSNLGPNPVTIASVKDAIPAQLTGASWTCTPGAGASCGSASGTGDINATVSLPSGASATFDLHATVVSGSGTGTLANTASVSPPVGVTDPDTTNNSVTVVNNIGTLDALTVQKDAIAPGTVVSSPAAINCGPGCSSATANFLDNSLVSLTATASAGAVFIGWSGGCTGRSNPCNFTIAGPTTVTASFGYTISANVTGGHGTITCPSPVAAGGSVACTITPSAGYALATLTDNGTDVLELGASGTYTISNVQSAHTVNGTFATACNSDRDCASGRYCSNGICFLKRINGRSCAGPNQCQSNLCVDGVCCNSGCTGQCQACDVSGSLGVCSVVTGPPHGSRTACLSDGTSCGGTCDGSSATSCVYPDSSTQCRAPSCEMDVETHGAYCNSSGTCPPSETRACGNYVCDTNACRADCSSDSDCAANSYCRASDCRPRGNTGDWVARGSGCSTTGGTNGIALALIALIFAFQFSNRGARRQTSVARPSSRSRHVSPRRSRSSSARHRLGRGAAGLVLVLFAAADARAQDVNLTFPLNRYQPTGGKFDILAVESAQVADHLAFSTSLSLNYARQPLRLLATAPPETTVVLVQSQTTFDLGFSLGLWDWAEMSAVIPLTSFQRARDGQMVSPLLTDSIPTNGFGDLRLAPKVRLFHSAPVQLALAAPITLPTGKSNAYLGNQNVTGGLRALVDVATSSDLRFSGNLGVLFGGARQFVDLHLGNALQYGLAMEWLLPLQSRQWAVLTTLAGEKVLGYGGAGEVPLEALAALRWESSSGVGLTLGGGPGLTNGYGTPRYRVLTSISWSPREASYASRQPIAPEPLPPAPVVAAPPPPPPPEPSPPPVVATVEPPAPIEKERVRIDSRKLVVLEPVLFETDSDVLLPDSLSLVQLIASKLKDNQEIGRLRIQGHTDSRGKPAHNLDLSRRRAARIHKVLIESGMSPGVLESEGFGPNRPIDTNATKEGRARNRRVDFEIVWRDDASR